MEDRIIQQFAELMLQKIEDVRVSDYKNPWISPKAFFPNNTVTMKDYNGFNRLFLSFLSEIKGYQYPSFMTFKQADSLGVRIRKGEKASPISFWTPSYIHKTTNDRISSEKYQTLSDAEKNDYKKSFTSNYYLVFNVSQTTLKEDNKEVWDRISNHFDEVFEKRLERGIPAIESMLNQQSWYCPIVMKQGNLAFYTSSTDSIHLPLKDQFINIEGFYSVLFHEMAHSTGHPDRLNRDLSGAFGNGKYAREELIAEMSAAFSLSTLGISSVIRQENAQYLKGWSSILVEGPKAILGLLKEVNKAAAMITEHINQKEQLLVEEKNDVKTTKERNISIDNRLPSFRDYKERVSIMQIAADLGYKPLKGKHTKARPVLRDAGGDTILIKNPTTPFQQLYWNLNSSEHGDVISFIENNINRFGVVGKNRIDSINQILSKYSGMVYDNTQFLGTAVSAKKLFRVEDYTVTSPDINSLHFLTKERGISPHAVESFLPFIRLVNERGYNNIGFPFTVAGKGNKIVGFELRNYGGFKSFSTGGDKINGTWIADFSSRASDVDKLFFFESAIDAISFYDIYKGKFDLQTSVFISTGGFPCTQQFARVLEAYPATAKVYACHDNDLAGQVYNIVLAAAKEGKVVIRQKKENSVDFVLDNKSFSLQNDQVTLKNFLAKSGLQSEVKAVVPKAGKDWNEILMNRITQLSGKKPLVAYKR